MASMEELLSYGATGDRYWKRRPINIESAPSSLSGLRCNFPEKLFPKRDILTPGINEVYEAADVLATVSGHLEETEK